MKDLKELIEESGLKKSYITSRLNMSFPTFCNRLELPNKFRADEIAILKEMVAKDMDVKKFMNFFCKIT